MKINTKEARVKYFAQPMPEEFNSADPEEISRGWGKGWVFKKNE